ncbi:SusC/RagA family TonB-linked outer membrane protein [Filimonas effusa]|uniref:SusC/RagA family TonB-linked outer membrane protein n=1 Tax=Filimonas effusa TaxID=2508721 RepID=A0A4Q1D1M3_9BACT|nr:SusC/RagA family TonB-linked outer membrane protein [Filimonas effusa]RXK81684.1 SusC/RagA family TonB-linked outer membrane protein [Filimonas effusa]
MVTNKRYDYLFLRRWFIIIILQVAFFKTYSQEMEPGSKRVTIHAKQETLASIFKKITRQTGLDFAGSEDHLDRQQKVTLNADNITVEQILSTLLAGKGVIWSIKDGRITIKKDVSAREGDVNMGVKNSLSADALKPVTGIVLNEKGEALAGATIVVKGTNGGTTTNSEGRFILQRVADGAVLLITYTSYEKVEVIANSNKPLQVNLKPVVNSLDETIVIAYGTTTKRVSTGTVSKVTAAEISMQPVSNPLAALAGRVSGMTVTQTSGNPGAAINIQIRGMNSISQGNSPLFIIDGIQFTNDYLGPNTANLTGANRGQSPFASINPADIESIEVLKDADATAIYGSRGANGVVLITTKKGRPGKTKVDANVYSGIGKVTRKMTFLNTQEYIAMRKEAFKNDGRTMTNTNAPDVLLWDNSRYIDWQKLLIGGTANYLNANISLSGGNAQTQFLLAANYNKETTVYPGTSSDKRAGLHINLNHTSADNKFSVNANVSYTNDNNMLPQFDLTNAINLSPNSPFPYDSLGNLNWSEKGASFLNPLSNILTTTKNITDNLITGLKLKYKVIPGLDILVTGGLNFIQLNQTFLYPKAAQNPAYSPIISASFGNTTTRNWIIEPQLNYTKSIGSGKIDVLLGSTFQKNKSNIGNTDASGFPNDGLITAPAFATSITSTNSIVDYRYEAIFGRINYNLSGKYLLNFTGRRDGSSRFGPGKQWANFGSIGIGWVFSEEDFIKRSFKFLSFGKFRSSYGITGNDQIGDYQFRDNYSNAPYPYQDQTGYIPSRLFNSNYAWEKNKKTEVAMELGFLHDRILLATNYFQNRIGNQLINYKIPSQSGFENVLRNFDAVIENKGWEFEILSKNILQKNLSWITSFNLSIIRNRLKSFPGLESSSYANTLVIGEPIGIIKTIEVVGVNKESGEYEFNGSSIPKDQIFVNDLSPKYFGGLLNDITYKGLTLSFLFQFMIKDGYNYNASIYSPPGVASNIPAYLEGRWQKKGDQTTIQRYATRGSAYTAYQNFVFYSNGIFSNASYVRLKNLSLSYSLPKKILKNLAARIYVQGQNLITFTNYKGLDPETSNFSSASLPPLKVYTAGIQITL